MTRPIDTTGLLPIRLRKLPGGAVQGTLPDGKAVIWDRHALRRPTRRFKRVMLNCYWWRVTWED